MIRKTCVGFCRLIPTDSKQNIHRTESSVDSYEGGDGYDTMSDRDGDIF